MTVSVHDDGYSRNASCALNSISTPLIQNKNSLPCLCGEHDVIYIHISMTNIPTFEP